MKIICKNEIIAEDCSVASNFWQKLRGKLFIRKPLILKNCNSIHTIFMRKKLDVIFLDKNNKIIKIYENVSPRCIIFPIINAKTAIEFDAGFIKSAKIKSGDILNFEE